MPLNEFACIIRGCGKKLNLFHIFRDNADNDMCASTCSTCGHGAFMCAEHLQNHVCKEGFRGVPDKTDFRGVGGFIKLKDKMINWGTKQKLRITDMMRAATNWAPFSDNQPAPPSPPAANPHGHPPHSPPAAPSHSHSPPPHSPTTSSHVRRRARDPEAGDADEPPAQRVAWDEDDDRSNDMEKISAITAVYEYFGVDPTDDESVVQLYEKLRNAPYLFRYNLTLKGELSQCVCCHTNLPYTCSRVTLKGPDGKKHEDVLCQRCQEGVDVDATITSCVLSDTSLETTKYLVKNITWGYRCTLKDGLKVLRVLMAGRSLAASPPPYIRTGWDSTSSTSGISSGSRPTKVTNIHSIPVDDEDCGVLGPGEAASFLEGLPQGKEHGLPWAMKDMELEEGTMAEVWGRIFKPKKGKKALYVKLNLEYDSELWHYVKYMREDEWGIDVGGFLEEQIDIATSTLVLMGPKDVMTWFHCDRDPALNFAVGVNVRDRMDVTQDTVLAYWVFVHPEKIGAADAWLKRNGYSGGLKHDYSKLPRFTKGEAEAMQKALGGEEWCFILDQRAGDLIRVSPGWLHCVVNTAPCIKVAWDYVIPEELPAYIKLWRDILTQHTANPADYGGAMWGMFEVLFHSSVGAVHDLVARMEREREAAGAVE
jgi:hypothetical protein